MAGDSAPAQNLPKGHATLSKAAKLAGSEDMLLGALARAMEYDPHSRATASVARALSDVLTEYQSEIARLVGEIGIKPPAAKPADTEGAA